MRSDRMPVIFIGHGSPMNAIHDNEYSSALKMLSEKIPVPEAVVVVSAHWQSMGVRITSGDAPEQIYDFYGFPEELYSLVYQPPGSSATAKRVVETGTTLDITPDSDRGIDHAAWAVMKHIYPEQNIPLLELSLDLGFTPEQHYMAGVELAPLRDMGILVIGSGNVVHNLAVMDYYEQSKPHDWAVEFDERVKSSLLSGNHRELIEYEKWGRISDYAVPTSEHYLPMLYAASMQRDGETVEFIHESFQHGTVSMRSFIIS